MTSTNTVMERAQRSRDAALALIVLAIVVVTALLTAALVRVVGQRFSRTASPA